MTGAAQEPDGGPGDSRRSGDAVPGGALPGDTARDVLTGDPVYPAHWEADVVLRDGVPMHIRPIRSEDADALQAMHLRQSETSVYYRFFAPLARISERDLSHYTTVDHHDRVALVLTRDEEIVAVGNYERTGPRVAEVAFYVDDSEHGRGLGSVLLEHLAAAARERGISTFTAEVLPANARMLRVFRDAGYEIAQRLEDGVIFVELRIEATAGSWLVMAEREQRAESLSMRSVLGPAGILIAGVGGEGSELARMAARSVLGSGYRGDVHLVGLDGLDTGDPAREPGRRPRIRRSPELRRLEAHGGTTVDLAVLAGAPEAVIEAIAELRRLAVPAVVVLSGGFAEAGPLGADRQGDLLRRTREAGIRLVGPASLGLIAHSDTYGRLNATVHPDIPAGAVGIFAQSAATASALVAAATGRHLGVGSLVSAGNRADVSGNDTMQAWIDTPQVKVAAVVLESIGNPRKFSRIARRLSASRPVVAMISEHTGLAALPGHTVRTSARAPAALSQMLDQAGVLRVRTQRELFDLVQYFESQPIPGGRRLAVVSNSATLAALLSARSEEFEVVRGIPQLSLLASAREYEAALDALDERQDWDVALVVRFTAGGQVAAAEQVAARAARIARPVVACLTGVPPGVVGAAGTGTVPCYEGVEDALAAVLAALRHRVWAATDRGIPLSPADTDPSAARELTRQHLAGVASAERIRLDLADTAELLRTYGIEILPSRIVAVADADAAIAAAEELGWPVAVKSTDEVLRHRTDLGGVRLDVHTPAELRDVVEAMGRGLTVGNRGASDLEIQSMAPPGAACVVRGVEDPLLGPVVSFGLGGDAVELLGDVAHRIAPLTAADVSEMVRSVRASPRLFGHRGLPALDVAALEELLGRVSVMIDDLPEVAELEINPALLSPRGVTVLAARIELAHPVRADSGRRVLPSPG